MSTSQDYLKQAAAAWFFHRTQRRDALLEIGRLLHLYIFKALEERDHLPTCKKREDGIQRRQLIQQATERLNVTNDAINVMIGAAMVVELLSGNGNVGNLSFHTIRRFHSTIRRIGGKQKGKNGSGNLYLKGKTYTVLETWEPRFPAAAELFQRAVRELWDAAKAKHELKEFLKSMPATPFMEARRKRPCKKKQESSKPSPVSAEQPRKRPSEYHGPRNSDDEPAKRIAGVVSACSPRDAADVIYQTILENDDPKALAGHLVRMLSDRQFAKDIRSRELEAKAFLS